jgi:hypothetical protein
MEPELPQNFSIVMQVRDYECDQGGGQQCGLF